jgi:hypothetical protein
MFSVLAISLRLLPTRLIAAGTSPAIHDRPAARAGFAKPRGSRKGSNSEARCPSLCFQFSALGIVEPDAGNVLTLAVRLPELGRGIDGPSVMASA